MSWLTFVQTLATFIVGPFGIGLMTIVIGLVGVLEVGFHHRWNGFLMAMAGGAILFSSAWTVNTFLNG